MLFFQLLPKTFLINILVFLLKQVLYKTYLVYHIFLSNKKDALQCKTPLLVQFIFQSILFAHCQSFANSLNS